MDGWKAALVRMFFKVVGFCGNVRARACMRPPPAARARSAGRFGLTRRRRRSTYVRYDDIGVDVSIARGDGVDHLHVYGNSSAIGYLYNQARSLKLSEASL